MNVHELAKIANCMVEFYNLTMLRSAQSFFAQSYDLSGVPRCCMCSMEIYIICNLYFTKKWAVCVHRNIFLQILKNIFKNIWWEIYKTIFLPAQNLNDFHGNIDCFTSGMNK